MAATNDGQSQTSNRLAQPPTRPLKRAERLRLVHREQRKARYDR
jgi:hypothetical protein